MNLNDLIKESKGYCHTDNEEEFESFSDFLKDDEDFDIERNICFSWCLEKEEGNHKKMKLILYFILPLRDSLFSAVINNFTENDIESLEKWIKPHKEYLISMFNPF